MIKFDTYYVNIDGDKVEISTSRLESVSSCKNILENLAIVLKKAGFELVYVSKTDHEEEAYQKDDYIVIVLYKQCVIKTNLSHDKLLEFVKMARFTYDASGAI